MGYIEELEKQNEELQQMLAVSQRMEQHWKFRFYPYWVVSKALRGVVYGKICYNTDDIIMAFRNFSTKRFDNIVITRQHGSSWTYSIMFDKPNKNKYFTIEVNDWLDRYASNVYKTKIRTMVDMCKKIEEYIKKKNFLEQ